MSIMATASTVMLLFAVGEGNSNSQSTLILSGVVSFVTAIVISVGALMVQERKLRRDFELDIDRARTMFMAEHVARTLLESERWQKRSFEAIKRRLGGFDDDELRRMLVRAGALRFEGKGGEELWGLLEKNKNDLV